MELMENIQNFGYHFMLLTGFLTTLPVYLLYKLVSSIITCFSFENVAGKVVLITGASSGIDEQLAYEYAKRKAKLVLVARRENLLQQVAQRTRELGSSDVLIICADVSKVEDCRSFVEETIDHFGQLDHLINNAGITNVSYFEESTNIDKLRPIMDVNFWGSVYTTQFALPHLKKSKGKIVVIASVAGWFSTPTISIYGASKAALINFYDTLRIELRSKVTITISSPSYTESEMTLGKQISAEGTVEINQARLGALRGNAPVKSAAEAATVIVNGVCWGKKHITDPSWMGILFLWKTFFPDLMDWLLHSRTGNFCGTSEGIISNETGNEKKST